MNTSALDRSPWPMAYTREVHFSCGHRYHSPLLSEEENQKVFGEDYSPHGLGHNFVLRAQILADLEPKEFHSQLKAVSELLDHRFLNEDVERFQRTVPTAENIAVFLFPQLKERLSSGVELIGVHLKESRDFWVDFWGDSKEGRPVVDLSRRYWINCLHRHHNPDLSMEENQALYHKCSAVHGHEYKVELTLEGVVDPVTGLVLPRWELDQLVKKTLIDPYHGQFLNDHLGNTSGEIIAEKFYAQLKAKWPEHFPKLKRLTLRETKKNSFFKLSTELER